MTQQWGNDAPWPPPGQQQAGWGQPAFGQHYGQWPQQPPHAQQAPHAQQPPQAQWPQPGQPGPWQQPGGGQGGQPGPYAGGQPGGWQQPGPWQSQQGPWGQPVPVPPKRRGPGRIILAALGLVALAFIGLALASALTQPTYQNEDYQVPAADTSPPDIPAPQDAASLRTALENNPLYRQKVASPVRCDMDNPDLLAASDAVLKAHFEAQMACLMRVWGPAFDATNTWRLYRPTVTIYSDKVTTPCGSNIPVNAFYCPVNQQVYYSRQLPKVVSDLQKPMTADYVLAHEFGHVIQGRSGIVASSSIAQRQATSKTEAYQISRRSELQADCFSGMWLKSVAQSRGMTQQNLNDILSAMASGGDDALNGKQEGDHGQAASRRYWGQMGLSTEDIGRCNTWTAGRELVR